MKEFDTNHRIKYIHEYCDLEEEKKSYFMSVP